MPSIFRRSLLLPLLFAAALFASDKPQDPARELAKQLRGKTYLFLGDCGAAAADAPGTAQPAAADAPRAARCALHITKASVTGDVLLLQGVRWSLPEGDDHAMERNGEITLRLNLEPNESAEELDKHVAQLFDREHSEAALRGRKEIPAAHHSALVGQRLDDGELIEAVVKGVTPPHVLETTDPYYSEQARRANIVGSVRLEIAIDATGRVKKAQVMRPLEASLDRNAINSVMQWRFQPATKNGKPVAVAMGVEIEFRLH